MDRNPERGFFKIAKQFITPSEIEALNRPDLSDSVFKDVGLSVRANVVEDTANEIKQHEEHLAESDFNLEAEVRDHPTSLYIKCFAIKANEMNDNGDWFSRDELKKAYRTFIGCPVFTNHQNTDVDNTRGKVLHSWYDDDKDGIMIIARVDAEAYPQLARGIKEKYVIGTSMGCQVQYSVCSICHNYAESQDQYCEHIKERKTRQVVAKKQKCMYHKHGTEDRCPVCGSHKKKPKIFDVEDKAYERNYGLRFIENSFVVNPACHDCGITDIIDTQIFLKKVAEISSRLPGLLKVASQTDIMCDDRSCVKLAGQKELDDLGQALELITGVSKTMLDQKNQIDLEFLSDLVKVLADLQQVTDELTQQGFGRLESPGAGAVEEGTPQPAEGTLPTEQPALEPVAPTPGGGSKVMSGPAGNVGTVTMPNASARFDLSKVANIFKGAEAKRRISIAHRLAKRSTIDHKFRFSK